MNSDDLLALRQLSERYADAIDRRDAEALRRVFAADGRLWVQRDGGPVEGEWSGEEVVGIVESVARYDSTFHHVGGCAFDEEDEEDEEGGGVSGRVRLVAHHYERTANGPVDLVMLIVYHDHYTRQPGGWLIQDRRVAVQWTELHPAHPRRRAGS